MAREVKRINLNVPVDTLEKIDQYAEEMSINRTSAIMVLVTQALGSQKAMDDVGELVRLYKKMEFDKFSEKSE